MKTEVGKRKGIEEQEEKEGSKQMMALSSVRTGSCGLQIKYSRLKTGKFPQSQPPACTDPTQAASVD